MQSRRPTEPRALAAAIGKWRGLDGLRNAEATCRRPHAVPEITRTIPERYRLNDPNDPNATERMTLNDPEHDRTNDTNDPNEITRMFPTELPIDAAPVHVLSWCKRIAAVCPPRPFEFFPLQFTEAKG